MTKPAVLTKIDQIIDADLGMKIVATAEAQIIDESRVWLTENTDDETDDTKAYLVYRGVQINPSTTPLGGERYALKATTT